MGKNRRTAAPPACAGYFVPIKQVLNDQGERPIIIYHEFPDRIDEDDGATP